MSTLPSLTGIALITGAASGIGRETGFLFAEAGCLGVVFADRNIEVATAAVKESKRHATNKEYRAIAVQVDVSDAASVKDMIDRTIHEFGRIDYSVNAAGISNATLRITANASLQELNQIIDINLKGTAFCLQAVIATMKSQSPIPLPPLSARHSQSPSSSPSRGAIVNIGSAYSYMTQLGTLAYTASKHGVIGLTKAAAIDHAKDGIRVNAVCPGPVDTPLMRQALGRAPGTLEVMEKGVPLWGRMARPEEVASVVLFLCGPGAGYVTGVGWPVDAGVTLGAARL